MRYQTDPIAYCEEILNLSPWAGRKTKGQRELFDDIGNSVQRQLAGDPNAPQFFRVEAGHGVGKSFGAAMLVNWFHDCFPPTGIPGSVILTTAPTKAQVEDLLWKDVKSMRPEHLPGRVLPGSPKMEKAPNWWAVGRTTSDNGGKGTARFQGQHNQYFFVVLDEAEGVPDFVFSATDAMMTGCQVAIVLMLANPQTRSSKFHKMGKQAGVHNYRFSVLDHPNVVDGADTVPGGPSRKWVAAKVRNLCETVKLADPDNYTFTLPFDVERSEDGNGSHGPAGTLFLPNSEFLFRVMGIAPANLAQATFVSPGRYERAKTNPPLPGEEKRARLGVDVSREGDDFGTIYVRHAGAVWREGQIAGSQVQQQGGLIYYHQIKDACVKLAALGVTDVQIRIDGTGGFGSTAVDNLRADGELKRLFDVFVVVEVHFGAGAHEKTKYFDLVTEMYAQAAETLKGIHLVNPPELLETDLTERLYEFRNKNGIIVQKLEEKDAFKKRQTPRRSPDDGDGLVLCLAPDHLFKKKKSDIWVY